MFPVEPLVSDPSRAQDLNPNMHQEEKELRMIGKNQNELVLDFYGIKVLPLWLPPPPTQFLNTCIVYSKLSCFYMEIPMQIKKAQIN